MAQPDAVVVGASFGGLLAAAGLAAAGKRVLIVDKDEIGDAPVARPGVPQGLHPHLLLNSGREVIEALLPGIFAELVEDGGLEADIARRVLWFHNGYFQKRTESRFNVYFQAARVARAACAPQGARTRARRCSARATGRRPGGSRWARVWRHDARRRDLCGTDGGVRERAVWARA